MIKMNNLGQWWTCPWTMEVALLSMFCNWDLCQTIQCIVYIRFIYFLTTWFNIRSEISVNLQQDQTSKQPVVPRKLVNGRHTGAMTTWDAGTSKNLEGIKKFSKLHFNLFAMFLLKIYLFHSVINREKEAPLCAPGFIFF